MLRKCTMRIQFSSPLFPFQAYHAYFVFLCQLTCKAAEAPPAPAANPTTAVPTITTGAEQAVTADVNIPTELLTNPHIRITTTATPQTLSTASALCVYSAAKRDYLIQRSVLLFLNIMHDYLLTRNNTITTNTTASKVPTTHVLVVAAAMEGIANIAFSAGSDGFQKYLMKVSLVCPSLFFFYFFFSRSVLLFACLVIDK